MIDLLMRENITISRCYEAYFSIIAPRFPIVSQRGFFYRMSHVPLYQDAHTSLLLLSMALLVRSSIKPDEPNLPGALYYTAKSFFTILFSSGKLSLELVQAGCLIAYYEYCQALLEVASCSIMTCAQMGYTLGLDKMLNTNSAFNSADKNVLESGRCVWWSIFICERYCAIFSSKGAAKY